ncbi:MAG: hypothetical protein HYR75_03340 [Gemmatimonadetes bacterium]|nr:hypothetical protein [Gemmatimonadota bacterium]MBI3567889.1 hypothetical protein [Gemmatimonadota bacterium]
MIAANLHHRFTREDAQLAVALLAQRGRAAADEAERALRDGGFDAVLDDPALPRALLESRIGARASLPLFAYVVARHALLGVGEGDRQLADFVASLLLHFGLRGRASRISDVDDQTYDTLASLLAEVNGPDPRRTLMVRVHLGCHALWLAGMFPDFIEHRRWRRGGPDIDYYDRLGERGFRLAAEHRLAHEHELDLLFASAARRFLVLRVALNNVSDALLFPRNSTPERLMRQVRDESRWRLSA